MSEIKPTILDFTKEELAKEIKPAFRAKQIYNWIYARYVNSFSEMNNIPKAMKEDLEARFILDPLKILTKEESSDGTIKYLFEMPDGKTVESVLLRMKEDEFDDEGKLLHHAKCPIMGAVKSI